MADGRNSNSSLHVVVFPWLAFGHLLPFLELSKCLAQRAHRVSFVSTPRNIQRLPKLPPHLLSKINFVELPLPQVDHLPNNAESTLDLQYHQIQHLKLAFDLLAAPFSRFLQASAPDWIVYDFAQHWLPPIAAELGVHCAFFNIFNAATSVLLGSPSLVLSGEDPRKEPEHFIVPPKWIPFPSNLAFRLYEVLKIFDSTSKENASGVSDMHRFAAAVQGCDVVVVRSCNEFEGEFLRLSQELFQKPVVPLGLLPPPDHQDHDLVFRNEDQGPNSKWVPIRNWLDKHEPNSVVFVAFGSEAKLSLEEIKVLALGLESSGLPFFWVLKNIINLPAATNSSNDHHHEIITRTISSLLPDGFEERVKGRGMVYTDWAPQLSILAHASIGGFLNHCGWSSVIEALAYGVPMVVLPLVSNQGLLARMVDWKKLGVEIPRNERDGSFTREAVAESLRLVMVEEEGEVFRENAKKMKEIFGNSALHEHYMDDFEWYIKYKKAPLNQAPQNARNA